MPKLYLLGGENVFKRSAKEVNERAFQEVGKPLTVLVFPWARASFDKAYARRTKLSDYFISLGAETVDFVEYSETCEAIAQKISASNLIYLTGGLVTALVERLKRAGVDGLLRSYGGVIVGRSAGALALCQKCLITNRHSKKVTIMDGLGLIGITLKAHYTSENYETLKLLSKIGEIYAVPASSAIIYDDGKLSFINEVYLFEDGECKTLN